MKILYFSPHPNLNLTSPAGYGTHMRGTIGAMRGLGHDVKLFIAGGDQIRPPNEKKHNFLRKIIKYIPAWIKETFKDYKLLQINKSQEKKLAELIRVYQPDLIYERSAYLMNAGVLVASKFGVKHYLEVNAPYIQEKKEMEGYSLYLKKANEIEKLKATLTQKMLVVSSALKLHFINKYGVDKQKVVVSPNGININEWNTDSVVVEKQRKRLNIKTTDFVVGFVGSILPHHGVDELITAFNKAAKPHWKLLIIGDGWPMKALRSQVNILGLNKQVIFTGNIVFSEVKNYMALFSVGVMPKSNWYGSPVKIFEYGAMKLPVIAPDNGPINDVMRSGETGLLGNGLASLIKHIVWVNEHMDEAKQMAIRWQELVEKQYSWIVITEKGIK